MDFKIKNDFMELTVSSKGAEKKSLICDGIEYIRQADQVWNRQAPFLFPNVGRLNDNWTIINGKKYELPQHGFLRDQEFEVFHQKADEISLINIYNESTLEKYPFKYKVIITYTLKNKTLRTKVNIFNEDELNMPFNFGGHPGFNVPLYENESFEDYKVVFNKAETFTAPSVTEKGTLNFVNPGMSFTNLKELNLDYKYFEVDAIVIPRVKSDTVKLINKEGKGIEFAFPKFVSLALWTRPNAKFLCLEPWIGYADRHDSQHYFIEKDNIIELNPLEQFSVYYDITILN